MWGRAGPFRWWWGRVRTCYCWDGGEALATGGEGDAAPADGCCGGGGEAPAAGGEGGGGGASRPCTSFATTGTGLEEEVVLVVLEGGGSSTWRTRFAVLACCAGTKWSFDSGAAYLHWLSMCSPLLETAESHHLWPSLSCPTTGSYCRRACTTGVAAAPAQQWTGSASPWRKMIWSSIDKFGLMAMLIIF